MAIKLFEHFDYRKLIKFTLPSIAMMIFTSLYGVVDGLFVSNLVGEIPFAAVNFIMPYLMILGTMGFMLGTGGSALVSKMMGEGDAKRANQTFSMLVYITIIFGFVLTVVGFFTIKPVALLMGASGDMLEYCVLYGQIICLALPAHLLQFAFQGFLVASEKPQLGLYFTLAGGIANIVLDALFMGALGWGIAGAAIATAISQAVSGIAPLTYFARKNSSLLRLCRARLDLGALLKTCTNGSSELMSNISMSLVGMLYNVQLMSYAGEAGVSAYGVMMYVNFVFISIFIGYSVGIAPVISYHFGAQNHDELKGLRRRSVVIIMVLSACMLGLGQLLAPLLTKIFVGYSPELYALTLRGFRFFCFSFLFAGMAIFGSSFFTALNDGVTSAIISFLRTLVFQIVAVIVLPLIWQTDGIWASIIVAELMAFLVTVFFMALKRKKYNY